MSIYSRTKEVANLRKISLADVEIKAGLSEKSLYKWKQSTPKADNLEKVANVLNVSVDYLLGRTDSMNTPNQIEEVDLRDAKHEILSYGGKPISDEDWAIIKRILESGISE